MKDKIINMIAKFSGVEKAWSLLDGKKTYAAAALGILTSLAGLGVEIAPILAAHNTAALLAFIQQLPSDPSWLSLVASFGLLGLGHKATKAVAPASTDIPVPGL